MTVAFFVQRNPVVHANTGPDPPRGNSALTMKEVEELEMLTQKLMKDMDHPSHAESSTSGVCLEQGWKWDFSPEFPQFLFEGREMGDNKPQKQQADPHMHSGGRAGV